MTQWERYIRNDDVIDVPANSARPCFCCTLLEKNLNVNRLRGCERRSR